MKNNEIQNISVIGAGFLGTQIGLQCAAHGLSISLVDPSRNSRKHSMNIVKDELAQRVSKGLINSNEEQTILSRMNYTSDLKKGVTDAELVIEAVPESLDLKRDIFAKLEKLTPTSTILATNSSSIKFQP